MPKPPRRGQEPRPLILPAAALSRRELIAGFGALTSLGVPAGVIASPAASAEYVMMPRQIEGPYYIEKAGVRSDVREGRPGEDLRLNLRIVDVASGDPIPGAAAEIWSCDADGWYSGFPTVDPDKPAAGRPKPEDMGPERFCRGVQAANREGEIEFLTLYPGWYTGRTVHVHVKVVVGEKELVTSQMYFPQDLNDAVHDRDPYAERGRSPKRNADDRFISQGTDDRSLVMPAMSTAGKTHVGALTIAVSREGAPPLPRRGRG